MKHCKLGTMLLVLAGLWLAGTQILLAVWLAQESKDIGWMKCISQVDIFLYPSIGVLILLAIFLPNYLIARGWRTHRRWQKVQDYLS